MSKIHNIQQGEQEWFDIRKGKMTASHAQAIGNHDRVVSGVRGKGLETYIYDLMAQYFSSGEKEYYSNSHIERGNELEEYAREIYELETGREVEQVGFVELDKYTGCSPDGICDDRLIEIKSFNDTKHFRLSIGKDKIEKKHIWQMQMQMLICEKDKCDFISYNPNFNPSLIIIEVEKDEEMQDKLKEGIKKGTEMIKEIINKYENAN